VKRILAIRFMRLGDVVLLLPALARLKSSYPAAHLTLLIDERCAPMAEMCPYIDEVMAVNRLAMRDGPVLPSLKGIAGLIKDVRRRQFDLIIDFLSFRETNLLTWFSGAPYRLGMKRFDRSYLPYCFNLPPVLEDKSLHVSDMFQRVVTAAGGKTLTNASSCPVLVLPEPVKAWAEEVAAGEPVVSLYVDAPVPIRRWPAEHFARVADHVIDRFGARILVLSGGSESGIGERARHLCRGAESVSVFSNLSLPQLTALIGRSRLLISNDTGPMHIGPALGVPTFGMFSVGFPEHFRPLGEKSRYLRANPIEAISPEAVIQQVEEMWGE
jgi:ADP-heptose:LPS heptosyltransferase